MTFEASQQARRLVHVSTLPHSGNSFLSLLRDRWSEVSAYLRQVQLKSGDELPTAGDVWFPSSAVLGLSLSDRDGHAIDVDLVGRDGLIESDLRPGARWIVRVSGAAHVLDSATFAALCGASAPLRRAVDMRRTERVIELQNAALCGRAHHQEGRLAGLLLRLQDQSGRAELDLSQEDLAEILGVQRTTITAVASTFKRSGAIRYSRGRITVLDDEALARKACPCSYEAGLALRLHA